jgi:radical SAM superfamily enzyme YgiQ (UPF0313 family)
MDLAGLQEHIQPLVFIGRYEQAIRECLKVWRTDKDNTGITLLIGRLYHRAGNAKEARHFFNLAGKHAGGDGAVLHSIEMFNRAMHLLPTSRTDIDNFCDPDIVLVQAPGWGVNTPPLATAMLTSFARKHGFKMLPLDLNIEFYRSRPAKYETTWELEQSLWFWETSEYVKEFMKEYHSTIEEFLDLVIASKTPVVGFTIYSSSAYVSIELARMLKERQPGLLIIFGGPHVSRYLAGSSIVRNDFIDAVVQGEGELTLVDILQRVKAGQSLKDCPGILVRIDNQIVDTGDRDTIKDLSQVPAPDFSDYAFELYRTPSHLPLVSSRGCPNRCIFCNERPFWRNYRGRSAENIFEEIRFQLTRYPSINYLDFQDSLVNGLITELEHLADLIIGSGLNVQWAGQAVIRKEMTAELMIKLKRSGCVCLAYGLETPSESLMHKIGKVMSKGADVNAIAEAHAKTGLGATYNFMFGLPGETEEDAFEAHEFLRRNVKYGLAVNPSSGFCGFAPGTLVYEDPQRYGIDLSKGGMFWESTDGKNTYICRLKRFEDFCRLVQELGISTTYPSTVLLDRNRSLGHFYLQAGQQVRAGWYFKAWLEEHPDDEQIRIILNKIIPDTPNPPEVAIRTAGCSASPCVSCQPQNCTDDNWVKGIARNWAAAFFIRDSLKAKSDFAIGRNVAFADGTSRRIIQLKENNGSLIVYLEGSPLDGNKVGYPKEIKVSEVTK